MNLSVGKHQEISRSLVPRLRTLPSSAQINWMVKKLPVQLAPPFGKCSCRQRSVEEGQEIAVLESMKTEVPVTAASAGTITWLVVEGQTVSAGQVLAVLSS